MNNDPTTHDDSFSKAMAHAADVYDDVLTALRDAGYQAEMIQTGGMCLAILVSLQKGDTVLITNKDEILPWDREDHRGLGVRPLRQRRIGTNGDRRYGRWITRHACFEARATRPDVTAVSTFDSLTCPVVSRPLKIAESGAALHGLF